MQDLTDRHAEPVLVLIRDAPLEGAAGTVTQTTSLSDAQRAIYSACATAPPPPITALTPA